MTKTRYVCLILAACVTLALPATSSADARKWYLAEGATTSFFDEQIPIANPNAAIATCAITFLKSDGTTVPHTFQIPAASRTTAHLDTIPQIANDAVSAIVECDLEVVVERTMYFTAENRLGGHNANGVLEPAVKWHLAEGATGFYNSFILIANTSPTTDAQTRVTFLRNNGAPPVVRDYLVTKNSRFTVWVNNDVPELADSAFSVVVESLNATPLIVERSMYWNNLKGGHATSGVTAPSTTWRFAEGFTAAGFQTFLLLANPSPTDAATARVTFFLEAGAPIVQDYAIGPSSRVDVWANTVPGLDNKAFSMLVESVNAVPLVAERAVYFNNFSDGHVTTGLTAESTRWGFAEGLEAGHFGTYFKTFYLFANSSVQPVDVKATFYREDGAGIERTFTIAPQSRRTIWAADYSELTNQRFSAFFDATNGVPFLAERAVYWDYSSYAGHASPGTPWPLTSAIAAPAFSPPAATVTGISPNTGPADGGTQVTISGTNFTSTATVSFGGFPGTVLGVVNATTIVALTPAHPAGAVDLAVTSNSATATLGGAFTFETTAPPPPPPPPPPPSGTPNGPPIARYPQSLPSFGGVIAQLARDRPDLLHSSCVEEGGNNQFMFEAVRRLRLSTGSNRWGLNIKRGNQGLSQDIVDYYYGDGVMEGSTQVYIIDIIGGHCGPNPSDNWGDVTQVTLDGGTIGRWTTAGQNFPEP